MTIVPAGMRAALDPGVRRVDGGTTLIGGSPLRLLRVTEAGSDLVDRLASGDPVPTSGGGARLVRRLLDAGIVHPRFDHVTATVTRDDVAVVIPVRGTREQVEPTIAALGPVGDVVVVDDGSSPPIEGATIRHEVSRGPGAAREAGWRTTNRPVVLFVDAEVVPAPAALDRLLAHLADPTVAAVAPRILPPGSPLDLGEAEAVVRPGSVVPYVPTTMLVVRRAALEQVGGFDPALRFGEDVDLVWRLAAAGLTVRYDPVATATHPLRSTTASRLRQAFDYGTSAAPLAVRHGAAVAPLRISGWSAAAWGLAIAGHPVLGLGVAAASTAKLAQKVDADEAVRLAGRGHLFAAQAISQAVRRTWLPMAIPALASRRLRPVVAAAIVAPAVVDVVKRRDPLAHLLDDAAYCVGVWTGSWCARTPTALLPASAGSLDRT